MIKNERNAGEIIIAEFNELFQADIRNERMKMVPNERRDDFK